MDVLGPYSRSEIVFLEKKSKKVASTNNPTPLVSELRDMTSDCSNVYRPAQSLNMDTAPWSPGYPVNPKFSKMAVKMTV